MLYSHSANIAVAIAGGVLSLVFCSLRCYTRIFLLNSFASDDFFSIIALVRPTSPPCTFFGDPSADSGVHQVFKLSECGVYLDGLFKNGFGQHVPDLSRETLVRAFRDGWLFGVFYIIGTGLVKISFAITLLRLMSGRFHRTVIAGTLFAITVVTIVISVLTITTCSPPKYFWEQGVDPWYLAKASGKDPDALGLKRQGSCVSRGPQLNYAYTIIILVVDLMLGIVLPFMILRNLNMRFGLKVTSGLLLALGTLATVASIARLGYLDTLAKVDILFYARPYFTWSDLEFSLCLIGTSAAMLKPLLIRLGVFKDASVAGSSGYSKGPSAARRWIPRSFATDPEASPRHAWFGDTSEMKSDISRSRLVG